jgi:hypothetical protein
MAYGGEAFPREMLWRTPQAGLKTMMREIRPGISDEDLAALLTSIQAAKEGDLSEYLPPLDKTGAQLVLQSFGPNLEAVFYLAQMTGAVPYSQLKVRKWELDTLTEKSVCPDAWSALSTAFSTTAFRFLRLGDGYFVDSLRSKGLLEDFRSYLRRLRTARWTDAPVTAEAMVKELADEWARAQVDWSKIEKQMQRLPRTAASPGGVSASFKGVLTPDFSRRTLGNVTEHLKSTVDRDAMMDSICMSLHVRPPASAKGHAKPRIRPSESGRH